jgi:NADPH-dependent 2,4-dienoyl-CoA reductase/sulfur reductase-like enzyme
MGSGIHTNAEGFVLVDEQMCTNVPNVYACGDCVNFPMPSLYEDDEEKPKKEKKRLNLPHWQIAQFQGGSEGGGHNE